MMANGGSGSALQLEAAAAQDLSGERVEPAYCVQCTRMFFRRAIERKKDAPPAVCGRCIEQRRRRAAEDAERFAAVVIPKRQKGARVN